MAFTPSVNAAEIRKNEFGQKSLNDLKEKYAAWVRNVLGQIWIREKGVFYQVEKRCEKCNTYKDLEDFYWRYSDNRSILKISKYCKECNKKNIENIQNKFELNSYILNICEQIDAPFIKEAWDKIINKYNTSQATIGRYIALMRLTDYQNYKFKDSIYCNMELWPININE